MADVKTVCSAPRGTEGSPSGFATWGRASRADAVAAYRAYVDQLRAQVALADATTDDELVVYYERGFKRLDEEVV